jgi:hypothetical protein
VVNNYEFEFINFSCFDNECFYDMQVVINCIVLETLSNNYKVFVVVCWVKIKKGEKIEKEILK